MPLPANSPAGSGLLKIDDSQLLVIDAQEHFYREHRTDVDRNTLTEVFRRVAWAVAAAKALEVPVVVTEEDAAVNGATDPSIRAHFPEQVTVLPKHAFSAADNPDILQALRDSGRSTVVLIGLETDICVSHTALQLQALGYRVAAVHDALFSPGQAHQNGLLRMQNAGIELISAKEMVYDWTRNVTNIRGFKTNHPELASPPGFSL